VLKVVDVHEQVSTGPEKEFLKLILYVERDLRRSIEEKEEL
jgi:hypothetical protein